MIIFRMCLFCVLCYGFEQKIIVSTQRTQYSWICICTHIVDLWYFEIFEMFGEKTLVLFSYFFTHEYILYYFTHIFYLTGFCFFYSEKIYLNILIFTSIFASFFVFVLLLLSIWFVTSILYICFNILLLIFWCRKNVTNGLVTCHNAHPTFSIYNCKITQFVNA